MTFSAIVSADTLQSALDSVSVLVDECKIHLEPEGLEIRAVDPANVGMVDLELAASGFESYEADGGLIGLNLTMFKKVIGMADSSQLIHLELNEQIRKLDIRFGEVDYTLALINPQSIRQEPDIPSLDAPVTLTATGKQLDRGVTAADLISDHVVLETTADHELVIDAEGDTDDVQVTFDEDDLVDGRINESVSSLFSLDYVTSIVGVMDADHEVEVRLDDEMPFRMSYDHSDGAASVTYTLSPRIGGGD
ncbi:DNA polymerase sliding clamp [Haloarcula onubensis]|uniref:DNA polymerase sliding clamp n=1 Tax=Haloarcula onubensis TaxID=2950539 RepID=A0ABU2FV99_9EURY|nr:DNA polymerase sliding clamp [Halomicroarcula sp. S3CR25-11]MDS0284710.1 DNA polymerase sliding clamp [Halomicroarcula sp. S3CR25-11]